MTSNKPCYQNIKLLVKYGLIYIILMSFLMNLIGQKVHVMKKKLCYMALQESFLSFLVTVKHFTDLWIDPESQDFEQLK